MADEVAKMKVADLKRELKIRGLTVTGNKNELVERLQTALIEGDVFDSTGISEDILEGDDILNDDELDEETKEYLNSSHDEDVILKSPQGSISSGLIDDPLSSSIVSSIQQQQTNSTTLLQQQQSLEQDPQQPQKKVVLKRKLTTSISLTESGEKSSTNDAPAEKVSKFATITPPSSTSTVSLTATKTVSDPLTANGDDDKKVVKLSELSMKERLELRAKKFGAPLSGDAMKIARAERFGVTSTTTNTINSKSNALDASVPVSASVDTLKKRAERFGGSVSKVMSSMENKEKLVKRQERFGSTLNQTEKNALEEKAKSRLERFKTAVK